MTLSSGPLLRGQSPPVKWVCVLCSNWQDGQSNCHLWQWNYSLTNTSNQPVNCSLGLAVSTPGVNPSSIINQIWNVNDAMKTNAWGQVFLPQEISASSQLSELVLLTTWDLSWKATRLPELQSWLSIGIVKSIICSVSCGMDLMCRICSRNCRTQICVWLTFLIRWFMNLIYICWWHVSQAFLKQDWNV